MSAGSVATSLRDHVRALSPGVPTTVIGWLGETAAFGLADGSVLLAKDGETHQVAAHPDGAVLAGVSDGRGRFLTGGDDGRVAVTGHDGSTRTLAETGGAWIDAVAIHPGGAFAYSAGRRVVARDAKGRERTYEAPSTARGLAFAPKGYRLAMAHYNGATLWYPNLETAPEALEWKGSHLDVTLSPDGRFVVTAMQENALHGWRLQPDPGHMRMTGYPGKVRSWSWSADGAWLATSGAEAVIVWPFASKEGPTGKAPRECGVRAARVTRVAFHPKSLVVAAGYEDGCILLIRFDDASELLVRAPSPGSPIGALAWDAPGRGLAFAAADGQAGVFTLPA